MKKSAALAALLLLSCTTQEPAPEIKVENAWTRGTVAGRPAAAIYLTIRNGGGEDRLIGISSAAGEASLHSTSTDGGIMRMRPLDSLSVPERSTVELQPGGTHIMLTGLNGALDAGSSVPVELRFERSAPLKVEVQVREASGASA